MLDSSGLGGALFGVRWLEGRKPAGISQAAGNLARSSSYFPGTLSFFTDFERIN